MFDSSYVKKSKTPNQNTDTPQEIGRDRFVPKGKGGIGPGSGHLETKPPTKKHVDLDTGKVKTNLRKPWAKGGGNTQVSFTAPKSRTKFATEKSCGKDEFTPGMRKYGTEGV